MDHPQASEMGPRSIMDILWSMVPIRVLTAAVKLQIFAPLEMSPQTAAEVARQVEADARGIRMLLDALVGIGFLTKAGDHYALTPVARAHLVPGKTGYLGDYVAGSARMAERWGGLAEAVRTGQPVMAVDEQETAEEYFSTLVRALQVTNGPPAQRLAAHLASRRSAARVLDVACGSGVWGIYYALADPQARITAHDFPTLLELARQYIRNHGVEDRFEYLPGDVRTVDFGVEHYDVAILGNICHSEGEAGSRALLRQMARALRPGGTAAIIDMIPNEARTGPPFPLLFALNMLLHTREGDTFTLAQYTAWAREAGLERVETVDIGSHSPAILATRP
ncbi:MAG: class I SAM-dependent methyltransferase [Armatimonadetes bacterium]|nr:class I SAM-dependent methyltransferase [Armatimonadota bacterium]